jgi:serine/threonine protein kinase
MTLHRLIKIRAETDNYYKDAEVLSMMVHLLRAVRDASGINVTHGGIHDENVFVGWGGRYHLGDFGIVRLKTRKA